MRCVKYNKVRERDYRKTGKADGSRAHRVVGHVHMDHVFASTYIIYVYLGNILIYIYI